MSSLTERHQAWLKTAISDHADPSFDEKGSREEARELLDWALNRLTPEDRMVLELIYLEGLSIKEATDLTGWSMANVEVRAFRSRRKLQKLLNGIDPERLMSQLKGYLNLTDGQALKVRPIMENSIRVKRSILDQDRGRGRRDDRLLRRRLREHNMAVEEQLSKVLTAE